jgi:demethylmenaquinone methyltransferase/2-methoxy-6-polyprenyl-1,4-benzoquinol methylase
MPEVGQIVDDYHRISACYDWLELFLAPVRRVLTRAVMRRGLARVLDVCCGTGTQVIQLRRAGVQAFGVDLSAGMLHQAAAKAHGASFFVRGDARCLPYPSRCFDALIYSFALHEKPHEERRRMLEEGCRVLKPHGTVFVLDYAHASGLEARLAMVLIAGIERMAGKAHYQAFRDYVKRGATEALFQSQGIAMISRHLFFQGAVGFYAGRLRIAFEKPRVDTPRPPTSSSYKGLST